MSKQKKGTKANPISTKEIESIVNNENVSDYVIIEAQIKDGFCNYRYEVIKGVGIGDKHKVDGSGIIEDDMRTAFSKFNVHLAVIDDVFKHSGIEIEDIDQLHTHELTQLFNVTGFKIKGSKENECIVLIGNKYVSAAGGRIELESPKIPLDNLSSYKWYNELKEASDKAREEVKLYKEGKYTAVEEDDDNEEPEMKSGNLFDEKPSPAELMSDFEGAKI